MVLQVEQLDGILLQQLIAAGTAWLAQHEAEVNRANVFPVPDGDTGTNMLLTMQRANQGLRTLEDASFSEVLNSAARGAMIGSRGNSGTILGMLFRGFAAALDDAPHADMPTLAAALQAAVRYTYTEVSHVMQPVEGTLLTVAQAVADAAQANTHAAPDQWLRACVQAAWRAVEATPEQLPRLREAGVVDAGGMGLAYVLEGMLRHCEGQPITYDAAANTTTAAPIARNNGHQLDPIEHYDVQFVMLGSELDVAAVRQRIREMGVSPLVYGDAERIKVHLHVANPAEPLAYAMGLDVELTEVVVENLHLQAQAFQQGPSTDGTQAAAERQRLAVIAVASGAGLHQAFTAYGASCVIAGGQTMNPSTEDFLTAIAQVNADTVLILPNNGNIIMAAEQAAELSEQQVHVLHTRSIPQGIAALLAYGDALLTEDDVNHADLLAAMRERMAQVHSAEITTATRAAHFADVDAEAGHLIALLDGELVAAGDDFIPVIELVLGRLNAAERELVTLYYGADITQAEAEALCATLQATYAELEFELVAGGQPLYPYVIGVE